MSSKVKNQNKDDIDIVEDDKDQENDIKCQTDRIVEYKKDKGEKGECKNNIEMNHKGYFVPSIHSKVNNENGRTVIKVSGVQAAEDVPCPSEIDKPIDLDDILVNELGQFGSFQLRNLLLVTLPLLVSGFMSDYIFIAAPSSHRCMISECGEQSSDATFEPDWILNAVPTSGSGFLNCQRFAPVGDNGTLVHCPASLFNQSVLIPCEKHVYENSNSMVYDFDLGCHDWLRGLIGTMGSLSMLCALPLAGVISDRFGRRTILVISAFNSGALGVLKAFSVNYPMSMVLQFLWTGLGVGTYNAAYIFAAEFVGPEYRVLMSAICSSIFAVGEVIMACVAWQVQSWRKLTLALNIPCFLLIANFWLLPESVRWLLSRKKFEEATQVLKKVAKVNGKKISEKSMKALINSALIHDEKGPVQKTGPGLVKRVLQSPTLLRRVCTTPICWVATTFVYYGLSVNSTSLSDTIYLNFILTSIAEIPGYFGSVLFLDRFGRKKTLFVTFALSSLCNFVFLFVSTDMKTLRLVLFLLGKCSISVVFASLYLYTAELYPTEYRHSLLNLSSMIGRIGSITAPLTPALNNYWQGLPSVMFGVMGLIAALLILTQPETLGTKLPDTLAEAEALGKPESKLKPAKIL